MRRPTATLISVATARSPGSSDSFRYAWLLVDSASTSRESPPAQVTRLLRVPHTHYEKPMPFETMWLRAFVAAVVTTAPLLPAHCESPDATRYVTPHSVAAVTVRVADTVRLPFAQNYPIEILAAASVDFLGLPIDAIDRVTAVIEPPMGITPQYVVVLNSSVPISLEVPYGADRARSGRRVARAADARKPSSPAPELVLGRRPNASSGS